jgi:hypothetical protein
MRSSIVSKRGAGSHIMLARAVPPLCLASLFAAHWWMFSAYLPTEDGRLGHDYSYFLPELVNGYYWYLGNGWFTVPWFTPAQCGGIPFYPNPESLYYSIPQLLTNISGPLSAVRGTFATFAALSVGGSYLLLRRGFGLSAAAAIFGACVVLFNGYFVHRMLIGHLGFHSTTLTPLIAYLMLRPLPSQRTDRHWRIGLDSVLAGMCVAYMIQSGNTNLLVIGATLFALGMLRVLCGGPFLPFLQRLVGGLALAVVLCASKLVSAFAFLGSFPRSGYPLPGFDSLSATLWIVLQSLFLAPATEYAKAAKVNSVWALERHELEYGLTVVPALILCLFAGQRIRARWQERTLPPPPRAGIALAWAVLLLLLVLPVVFNYYTPGWNAVLKQIPILKSSSSLIRWVGLYVPVLSVASALALQRLGSARVQTAVAAAGIAAVVGINGLADRSSYASEYYNPKPLERAHQRALKRGRARPVATIVAAGGLRSNEWFIRGESSTACYGSIFGYRNEWFPGAKLHPGPVFAAEGSAPNLLSPACFVFPEANRCEAGDLFAPEDSEIARDFAAYRPIPFARPLKQRMADVANLAGLGGVALFLLLGAARRWRRQGE